ncbi:hypothetical protein ACKI2N_021880 [Cupriavidus sp. 30B13]|uniref:hypothetical protein n=1 Tax=Cupriavidus sp. 30B13 TaxID=3384241 RepID=UPI003B8F194C
MASDYSAIIKYMPFAKGVYGTGSGTQPLAVGWNQPVTVTDFKATSPNFQAALYKDSQSGKYHIAIAGTDDLKGDAMADLVLAGQDAYAVGWHPEMTDALSFSYEAIKQIRSDLERELGRPPELTDIRARVDVSGHSLGGALAEMVGKFFGLSGYNIDGPGVTKLITRPEYGAFQDKVREDFPELESDYKLAPGQFGSTAFSIVGAAGTHLDGVAFTAQPGVLADYFAMVGPLAIGVAS